MPVFELSYLLERDYPWLRAVLDERLRFAGRREREWRERLGEPFEPHAPQKKLREAARVLERLSGERVASQIPPAKIREVAFRAAALTPTPSQALAAAAASLELPGDEILEHLFGDLRGERRIVPPPVGLTPALLALETNQTMAAGLLARSRNVVVRAVGGALGLVHYAKSRGLIATAKRVGSRDTIELEISGPLALFRHSRVYGRALAGILPRAAACGEFSIRAVCRLGSDERVGVFRVAHSDPIATQREPVEIIGRTERRFAEEFELLASDWELAREPEPIALGDSLIFPDFELVHRKDPRRRFQLEVLGYWTSDYIARRACETLIVCVDERLACGAEQSVLDSPRVVAFRRRIDVERVLDAIERRN